MDQPTFLSYPLAKAAGIGVDLGCAANICPTMNRTIVTHLSVNPTTAARLPRYPGQRCRAQPIHPVGPTR